MESIAFSDGRPSVARDGSDEPEFFSLTISTSPGPDAVSRVVVRGFGRAENVQGEGKLPGCHPILEEVTGPALGVDTSPGAVQLGWSVWAPYQMADPTPRHTSQHVPLDDRAARVTVPLFAPAPPPAPAPAPPAASALLMADPMDPLPPPEGDAPTVPVPTPLPLVTVTLTVDGLVVAPATYETDGSEAERVPTSSAP